VTSDASKLRVMLLAPQFWTSGTVTLARQLQAGWPDGWARPRIACPTKSGKPSKRWGRDSTSMRRADSTPWMPDIVGSPSDIARIARESFDVVHVTEPDAPGTQRWWWHELLQSIPVPWSLTLNGNAYPDVSWNHVLRSTNFTGVVWCTPGHIPPELRVPSPRIGQPVLMQLPRPYALRHPVDAQLPRASHVIRSHNGAHVVGTHCRIAPDKGIALIAALARHTPAHVCLDGAPQAGAMPYTLALQQRYVPEDDRVPAEARWLVTSSDRSRLRGSLCYNGAFTDGVIVAQHHTVHVSATRYGFSAGHEYALLEAIDAGCLIVQPQHMIELECDLRQYSYDWSKRGIVGALTDEHRGLSLAVNAALHDAHSSYDQSHNRRRVAEYHNTERLVKTFTSEVLHRL